MHQWNGLGIAIGLVLASSGQLMAQATGQSAPPRYSIDGPGGGVQTTAPVATRPVPPAAPVYQSRNRIRGGAPLSRSTNGSAGASR